MADNIKNMEWKYYIEDEFLAKASSNFFENVTVLEFAMNAEVLNFYKISAKIVLKQQLISQNLGSFISIDIKNQQNPLNYSGLLGKFKFLGTASSLLDKSIQNSKEQYIYEIELYPTFWKLNFEYKFRIFQNKTKREIIKLILNEKNINFKFLISDNSKICETCTQFNESTFDFLIRLMQEENVFCYYEFFQSDGFKEPTLILKDGIESLNSVSLKLKEFHVNQYDFEEIINFNSESSSFVSESSLFDYDFKNPKTYVKANAEKMGWIQEKHEFFGENKVLQENSNFVAENFLNQLQRKKNYFECESTSLKALPGNIFEMNQHAIKEMNAKYFIEKSYIHLKKIENKWVFRNNFSGTNLNDSYICEVTKKKPKAQGNQTAIVAQDEKKDVMNVNKFGQIKVIFNWKNDDNTQTSAWVRVMQWGVSGNDWGNVAYPRVNQEVVVGFLNADIDQPIVLGTLFNGANEFPYEMPGDAPNLTMKSKSVGLLGEIEDRYNEIRMVNKELEEKIKLRSQRDIDFEALNNMNETILENRTIFIGSNEEYQIKGNRFERFGDKKLMPGDIKIGTMVVATKLGDAIDMQTMDQGLKMVHIDVGMYFLVVEAGDISFIFEKGQFMILGKSYNLLIYENFKQIIEGSSLIRIAGDSSHSVQGDSSISVAGAHQFSVEGVSKNTINGDYILSSSAGMQVSSPEISITADAALNIEAGEISIKAGAITIESGDFSLQGAAIELTSDAVFEISAGAAVSIKGAIIQLG